MSEERKPLWPWIVALLIGLPVLYVASYGPVCWLCHHDFVSTGTVFRLYRPFAIITLEHRRGRIWDFLKRYEAFCTGSSAVLYTMELYEERRPGYRKQSGDLSVIHREEFVGSGIHREEIVRTVH